MALEEFNVGQRVRHLTQTEWGLGVIKANDGNKVEILFEDGIERKLILSFANLVAVKGSEGESDTLDRLLLKKKIRTVSRTKKTRPPRYTFSHLREKFLAYFSKGFYDKKYFEQERDYKLAARTILDERLNQKLLRDLIKTEQYEEICLSAKRTLTATNLAFTNEVINFSECLKSADAQRQFSDSLNYHLYGDATIEERFEAFSNCLLDIGAPKWTIATYFLYLLDPKKYMFMKPEVTKLTADSCGFLLNYRPQLNILTYKGLGDFAEYLTNDLLRDLRPRDYIDIQSFIWCSVRIADGKYGNKE
jgi:hypothetical protein